MGRSISIPNGILSLCDTDFLCPECNTLHTSEDYYDRLYKAKKFYIYKQCKTCKIKLGITYDIRGDVRVWIKDDENNHLNNKP